MTLDYNNQHQTQDSIYAPSYKSVAGRLELRLKPALQAHAKSTMISSIIKNSMSALGFATSVAPSATRGKSI